jgi:hypothetical protein
LDQQLTLNWVVKAGAWSISLARMGQNNVIISPDRIELSNQIFRLGDNINLHLNGELAYPRYLPNPRWAEQFNFLPSRVGIKVLW